MTENCRCGEPLKPYLAKIEDGTEELVHLCKYCNLNGVEKPESLDLSGGGHIAVDGVVVPSYRFTIKHSAGISSQPFGPGPIRVTLTVKTSLAAAEVFRAAKDGYVDVTYGFGNTATTGKFIVQRIEFKSAPLGTTGWVEVDLVEVL